MNINFSKYQGTGNDFVILDNRSEQFSGLTAKHVKHICNRRFGIGADGLMLLQNKAGYDFEMVYFNSDGHHSSMCGNGGRCLIKFAYHLGMHKYTYNFLAVDGPHEAEIENDGTVRLKMKDVHHVDEHNSHAILNTGSPHYIKFESDVAAVDVVSVGREIRNSSKFQEHGINVNFVESTGEDSIFVRTYERGVEDETMSCGTGVTAAALVSAHNELGFNRVEVRTPGGFLSVEYNKINEHSFDNIWLCGPAELVFTGTVGVAE